MDELDLVEYRVAGMPLHWKILNAARFGMRCDWNHGQLTSTDPRGWVKMFEAEHGYVISVCIERN